MFSVALKWGFPKVVHSSIITKEELERNLRKTSYF